MENASVRDAVRTDLSEPKIVKFSNSIPGASDIESAFGMSPGFDMGLGMMYPNEESNYDSNFLYKDTESNKNYLKELLPVQTSTKATEPRYASEQDVKLYLQPNESSKLVSIIENGTEVKYFGNKKQEKNGKMWAEVIYDGKRCWVEADKLKKDSNYTTAYYGTTDYSKEYKDLRSGDYSFEELKNTKGITAKDLLADEKTHIKRFSNLVDLFSGGKLASVGNSLVTHFLGGTGDDYSHPVLTEAVKNQKTTQKFMNDFSNVFKEQLKLHNGNISTFANSENFRDALKANGVMLSQYNYEGLGNIFGGLTVAIHGWTESQVEVVDFKLGEDGTYSGTLRFIFKDNFGLDPKDVEHYSFLRGFRSWFILQHDNQYKEKYKPFKTVVTIDYTLSGQLKE